jgi:hypothetical protein
MKKILGVLSLAVVFAAQTASAQVYYPNPTPSYTNLAYSGSCVSITRDISVGSRGADVLSLQKFIVSRNYPGGGSWMLTAYYGSATRAGVINFQIDMRLPQTGVLDAQTRAALTSLTCLTGQGGYNPNLNLNQYPWQSVPTQSWPGYPYNPGTYNGNCGNIFNPSACQCTWYTAGGINYNTCGTNYGYGSISISQLSPHSGVTGQSVTVYGSGFSSTNNTVRFGNATLYGISSYNGTSLTFAVPSTQNSHPYSQITPGVYNVSVVSSTGASSNSLPFTVNGYGSGSNANAPWISNVSGPNTISVNTTGTWIVSITNPNNANYTSISVNWGENYSGTYAQAPQQVYGTGSQQATFTHAYAQAGTYTITVTTSNSYGSNTFSVTVNVGASGYGTPHITSITPLTGSVGTVIQITGTGFSGDNTVHFGIGGKSHVTSMSGNYIYYTVPSTLSPCDVLASGSYCAQYFQNVTPGQYQIYVTVNGVNSNSLTFTVQ